ncbi:MAG: HDOD domain-containing protein [Planctomycetota bacterium]|nr:MAG: HDOD domain-containing protein [Planctomycetota bacterium]
MDQQSRQIMKKKVEALTDLPTLPIVVLKLNEMLRNPSTSAQDIGELLQQDLVISARTLKLVNSAYYGFPRKIASITRAIVILGFQKVRDLALTVSVMDIFNGRSDALFSPEAFWQHALTAAIATETIAGRLRSPEQKDAFMGGLLHDMGRFLLARNFSHDYAKAVRHMQENGCPLVEAERAALGFDHGLVGEWLTEKWKFPSKLVRAIRYHHSPDVAKEDTGYVYLVHAGDVIARAVDVGVEGANPISPFSRKVWKHFNINRVKLDSIIRDVLGGLRTAQDFFDLIPKR